MSNVLRELFVKISMMGSAAAKQQQKDLGDETGKTTKKLKEQKQETDKLGKSLEDMAGRLSTIGNVLKGLVIGKALGLAFGAANAGVRALQDSVKRSIGEAAEAEQGLQNLATALTITGEFSQAAMDNMQEFAARMQETTTASDDLVIALLAQVKAYGATNEQAKKIVETGIDFASATGKDIPSAVEAIALSLSGMTREIQRYVPAIKGMTDEQLAAGSAIDALNKRFSGTAAKNLVTYAGAAGQLANAWGDVFENMGSPIAKALIPIFKELTATIQKLLPSFTKFGEDIAQSFLIVREAFFAAFNIGGGAEGILKEIGAFIIDAALLIEDFFFFLSGERSAIGQLTGAGNLAELIGVGLGNALTKIPGILFDVLKMAIPPIIDALRGFFFTILASVVELVVIDLPTMLIDAVTQGLKAALPTIDAILGGMTGMSTAGIDTSGAGLPGRHQIESGIRSLFATTVQSDQAGANLSAPGDSTLNKNDNRSYSTNMDVKIQTNAPANAIQRQLNSLYFSQQTAGGN